jgi:phosphoglycolate phosphatase
MSNKFKAVIFDLDGTLLNTLTDIADSMNRVLSRLGHPTHPTDAYKYFVGEGIVKLATRVLPEKDKNEQSITACVNAMHEEYGNHCQDQTKLYDGIEEMLTVLTKRGVKLAVLSNKPDELTRKTVSHYLGTWNFSVVAGAKPDLPPKPEPDGALRIARKMHLSPADFLYLGDSNIDMKTANGAGMYAIGALWGFRTKSELEMSGARAVIEKPVDIVQFLK